MLITVQHDVGMEHHQASSKRCISYDQDKTESTAFQKKFAQTTFEKLYIKTREMAYYVSTSLARFQKGCLIGLCIICTGKTNFSIISQMKHKLFT